MPCRGGDEVSNATNPYALITGTPWDEVNETEGPITVNVLIAGDEEAQNTLYWLPLHQPSGIFVDWISHAQWQIERADESLVYNFGIDLRIRGATTWDSNDSLTTMRELAEEMHQEIGWNYGFTFDGNEIHILFGLTEQYIPDPVGVAYGLTHKILLRWVTYWADDNLAQHELSHIFRASDHREPSDTGYYDDCIMSYRPQFVAFLYEDGIIWAIFANVATAYLTHNYHTDCDSTIRRYSYQYTADVDKDGKIDIKDIAIVAKAFGSEVGDPDWNPIADVNDDGKVDIRDLAIVAGLYGMPIWRE